MTKSSTKTTKTIYNITSLISQARAAGFEVSKSNFEIEAYAPGADYASIYNPNAPKQVAQFAADLAAYTEEHRS